MLYSRFVSVMAGVGCGLVLNAPVLAQGLEEVLVTARKRVETVQDTPVSVRAISAERIERYDITSLEKVASMSPEFSAGRASSGSGAQLSMRGIGSSATSIGIEQSVAVIVDDVYYGQGRTINEGMLDLERVELLKGPQALFFGKNATAGAVSLTTANPDEELKMIGRFSRELEADQTIGEVILSGPLTEKLGARLALRTSRMNGALFTNKASDRAYNTSGNVILALTLPTGDPTATPHVAPAGERDLPGEEELLGRFTLSYEATDRLFMNLKVSGTRSENDNPSSNYIIYNCPNSYQTLNPAAPCEDSFDIYQNGLPPEVAATIPYAEDGGLYNDYRSWQMTGTAEYDFNQFTLTSVTNVQSNDNRFLGDFDFQDNDQGVFAAEKSTWEAFSEELRLLSNFDSSLNFMLGVFYQQTQRDFEQYIAFLGAENTDTAPHNRYLALSKISDTEGETLSPFFQLIWFVLPDVELTAGARYTRETKDSHFIQPYVHPELQSAAANLWREGEAVTADQKFENWSPEVSINWTVTEDVMVYAAYKSAFKSGGFSNSGIYATSGTVADFTFEPETARGYEFGAKTTLFGQLRLNATVYAYDYDDLQVDFFNAPSFAFVTVNAGAAENRGIELETEYAPRGLPGLIVRGALNYNKAEYKDFIAPCWTGQKPSEGCNTIVPQTVATPGQDISGESTSMAPELTAALGVDYELDLRWGMTLGLSVNAQYIDDYNPSSFAIPHAARDNYVRYDAGVRLGGAEEHWEIAVIGKNLSNEVIIDGAGDTPSTGGNTGMESGVPADQVGFASLPRTVALQFITRY